MIGNDKKTPPSSWKCETEGYAKPTQCGVDDPEFETKKFHHRHWNSLHQYSDPDGRNPFWPNLDCITKQRRFRQEAGDWMLHNAIRTIVHRYSNWALKCGTDGWNWVIKYECNPIMHRSWRRPSNRGIVLLCIAENAMPNLMIAFMEDLGSPLSIVPFLIGDRRLLKGGWQ